MATQAHCAFCFEVLTANLENRSALTLPQVEYLWKQYTSKDAPPDSEPTTDADASDAESYRPAAISRLLANTPSTASSPSVQSTSSTPSATSKNSSRSSFFSPPPTNRAAHSEALAENVAPGEKYPLFVTWNVLKGGDKRLRGCIGTFEPHDLADGLEDYALVSALNDTRFTPISLRELPSLECGVTLLTDFEPVADCLDWDIGTHGLRIAFTYHGKRLGATYLPDVALEQGWTKEEALVSLMRKAGWTGRREDWGKVKLEVVRYRGSKAKMSFGEYGAWREWVDGA